MIDPGYIINFRSQNTACFQDVVPRKLGISCLALRLLYLASNPPVFKRTVNSPVQRACFYYSDDLESNFSIVPPGGGIAQSQKLCGPVLRSIFMIEPNFSLTPPIT